MPSTGRLGLFIGSPGSFSLSIVKSHLENIFRKPGISHCLQLIVPSHALGLVQIIISCTVCLTAYIIYAMYKSL